MQRCDPVIADAAWGVRYRYNVARWSTHGRTASVKRLKHDYQATVLSRRFASFPRALARSLTLARCFFDSLVSLSLSLLAPLNSWQVHGRASR